MYNSTVLKPLGRQRIKIRNPANRKRYNVEFVIVKENLIPILGKQASEQMGLITVHYSKIAAVTQDATSSDKLMTEYADVFERDIGTLPGDVHLHVDETATPVNSATGRVPVASRPLVKAELSRLQKRSDRADR